MDRKHISLSLVRSHERMDYKRCPTKWYWKWRVGLVPVAKTFGALDLGTWAHYAFEHWYGMGYKRNGDLVEHFRIAVDAAIRSAVEAQAPLWVLDQAEELAALGEAMMIAYQRFYGADKSVYVLAVEIPLEFSIPDPVTGEVIAIHKLKPDMVYRDTQRDVWLMENKTAAQIRTEHLVIDDQARPYGAMAERALRKLGIIPEKAEFKGIMYNFIRKALPDEREMNKEGKYLNKNGTVSKRQPTPLFLRYPVKLTRPAKVRTLERVRAETILLTTLTTALRNKRIDPRDLPKTPHSSCSKTCQFFTMCVADEQGTDIRDMQQNMYVRQDPYDYEDSTDIPVGFEMG
jgi:hypothetical protein